jgi:mRNA interferase HigB
MGEHILSIPLWWIPTLYNADAEERGKIEIIGNNRVVFNIKGNGYRPVVLAEHRKGRLFIRFVGAHEEYNRLNAAEV